MQLIAPEGYISIPAARDVLMRRMHQGVPLSDAIRNSRDEALDLVDGKQAAAAAGLFQQGIRNGELALFAVLSSRDTPMRLHNRVLIEAALFPSNSTVLTFAYCTRRPGAPFGISWQDLKELARDPLCLGEKEFKRWLRKEERKKEWPCHQLAGLIRNPPGRPPLINSAIEVIEQLSAEGKLTASTPTKVVHGLLQDARPTLRGMSEETVRRARKEARYTVPQQRHKH